MKSRMRENRTYGSVRGSRQAFHAANNLKGVSRLSTRLFAMTIVNATAAREKLFQLIAETSRGCEPVTITSKNGNVVMISEEDWRTMQETLYLGAIPGMTESILQGKDAPADEWIDINEVDLDAL